MKHYGLIFAGLISMILCCSCGNRADFTALMKKAEKNALAGQWNKTLECTEDAVSLQPKNVEAIVLHALALEHNGKNNNALEEIAKASSLSPGTFFVQYTHGRMLFERGRYESCIAPLKNALKLRPGNTDTLLLLARVSTIQKNMQDAKIYYSMLAKSKEYAKDPAPWNELGMIVLLEDKSPKKSVAYFNYAYRLAQSNPTTVLNMAVLCDRYLNDKKNAKAFYQHYLALTKHDSSLSAERSSVEKRVKSL